MSLEQQPKSCQITIFPLKNLFHILMFLETLNLKTSLYILGGGIFLQLINPVLYYK